MDNQQNPLRTLELFAGAGGGILGGHLLGEKCICAVEYNAYARSVLLARQNDGTLPPFPIWDDVRTFDGKPWRGIVDVVSGGFPCQDISAAGKGAGIEGERSGLWREMVRIIREIRPAFVRVENSPMLTSRGMGTVLGDLSEMGFDARWGIVSAESVGAPHVRERIWIYAADPKRMQQFWKESRSRTFGRVGREQQSMAWNGDWEDKLSSFRGMGNGLARAVDRTDAIRNGQVPRVAATAWRILSAST